MGKGSLTLPWFTFKNKAGNYLCCTPPLCKLHFEERKRTKKSWPRRKQHGMEDNAAPVSFGFGGWKVQKKQKVTQPSEALSHVFGDLTHDINRPSPTFVAGENETDDHKYDGQNKRKADQDEKQSAQRESKRLQEDGNNLAEAGKLVNFVGLFADPIIRGFQCRIKQMG